MIRHHGYLIRNFEENVWQIKLVSDMTSILRHREGYGNKTELGATEIRRFVRFFCISPKLCARKYVQD